MKKSIITLLVCLTIFSILIAPTLVSATVDVGLDDYVAPYIGLGTQDIRITIAAIIKVALGLLGIVAVIIILIGGFKYMTSMGNAEEAKKATALIVNGVIGLVIVLTSFAIASFILNSIITATTDPDLI